MQQAGMLVACWAFIYTVAACRRPPVSSPSFVALETGFARFIRLSACSRRATGRPLSHALLAVVEHSVAPCPKGVGLSPGAGPHTPESGDAFSIDRGPSVRKDCKRSAGSQTGRKTPSTFSLPDLRRTGCSTVHHEAAASLIALCPATHLPVTYWPADSAPLIAPLSLPSECCRLALRSQPRNFLPVRRLALRSQCRLRSTPALRIGIFPMALPARLQSLFAHFMQSPGLPPAPRIGILNEQMLWLSQLKSL